MIEGINGNEQIAAVARAVEDRKVEGRLAKVVELEQTYATSVDDLWDAVTSVERLPRWFAPVSGDLREGGHFAVEGNASGTITACDPPRSFDATWEFGGAVSWIEVRLAPVGSDHTRLSLSHIAHPDEHWDQFGPGAAGVGWDLSFLGLQLHLAKRMEPAGRRSVGRDAGGPGVYDEERQRLVRGGRCWRRGRGGRTGRCRPDECLLYAPPGRGLRPSPCPLPWDGRGFCKGAWPLAGMGKPLGGGGVGEAEV